MRQSSASARAARVPHAVVALMVLGAIALEPWTAFRQGPGIAGTKAERLTRLFSYFTIQSNILLGVTSALLAVRPDRDGRVFRVARLDGLLCIVVTGIVYHAVLTGVADLTPAGELSNLLLHTAVPIGALLAWLLTGPRPRIDRVTALWAVAYPMV